MRIHSTKPKYKKFNTSDFTELVALRFSLSDSYCDEIINILSEIAVLPENTTFYLDENQSNEIKVIDFLSSYLEDDDFSVAVKKSLYRIDYTTSNYDIVIPVRLGSKISSPWLVDTIKVLIELREFDVVTDILYEPISYVKGNHVGTFVVEDDRIKEYCYTLDNYVSTEHKPTFLTEFLSGLGFLKLNGQKVTKAIPTIRVYVTLDNKLPDLVRFYSVQYGLNATDIRESLENIFNSEPIVRKWG